MSELIFLLGYDLQTSSQKILAYNNLAQQLATDYSLTYPSTNGSQLCGQLFEKLKKIKASGIADVYAPKGGDRPTVCRQPAYSVCLAAAFVGGLETAGILGAMACYMCYCDCCTGSNVDKFCGTTGTTQPSNNN